MSARNQVRISEYSKTHIRNALPENGKGSWSDDGFVGLQLRGNKSSARWSLRTRINGQRLRIGIGSWPALDNKAAREVAAARMAAIAMAEAVGANPAEQLYEARARKTDLRRAPTLAEIFEPTVIDHLSGNERSKKIARSYWHSHMVRNKTGAKRQKEIKRFLSAFWAKRPSEVPKQKLIEHIEAEMIRAPAATKAIMRALRPAWKWMAASPRFWCEDILAGIKVKPDAKRTRDMSFSELAQVWQGTHQQPNIRGHLVRTLMLTALRLSEVASLRVGDVDFAAMTILIPAPRTKTDTDYLVPISSAALAELEVAIELSGAAEDDHYIFAGRNGPTAPYNGFSKLQGELRKVAPKIPHWSFHDFRSAFMSRMLEAGQPIHLVDRCLNHHASQTQSKIAQRYNRTNLLDERRECMNFWSDQIQNAVAATEGRNVVILEALQND